MNVSVAAISRHVSLLEAHLGEALLHRRRAGVVPTERGRNYLDAIGEALDRIEGAGRDLHRGESRDVVRLAIYPTLTTEWLAPRLVAFRAAHPGIDFDVVVSKPGTAPDSETDIWVTAFPNEIGDNPSTTLFETLATLVCTPDMRDQAPALLTPAGLSEHLLLHAPRERQLWDALLVALGAPDLRHMRQLRFDTLGLTVQAARGGGGVALAYPFFLVDDLRTGKLVLPFDLILRFDAPHFLACRRHRASDPHVAAMYRWLLDEARTTSALLHPLLAQCRVVEAHVEGRSEVK